MRKTRTIIRLAVIGGGHRGIHMAGDMTDDAPRAEMVAVAEPRDDRREDCRRGLSVPAERYYRNHRELLEHLDELELDAVIIATDVATHHEIACACMEAGLGVFLEKPMTRTLDEAADLVRAAERTGVPVHVGFNLRYSPFFGKLHEIVTPEELEACVYHVKRDLADRQGVSRLSGRPRQSSLKRRERRIRGSADGLRRRSGGEGTARS